MESNNTTIQISKGLWKLLNNEKDHGQSFEDVIVNLLSFKNTDNSLSSSQDCE